MLGDNLLAAPVFNDRGETETYLPNGVWTNWFTDDRTNGGRYVSAKCGYFSLPLWVRPNSIIAAGKEDSTVDYDYEDGLTLHVFELEKAETTICGKDGKERFSVYLELEKAGDKAVLKVEGEHNGFKLLFRNIIQNEIIIEAGCKSMEINFD